MAFEDRGNLHRETKSHLELVARGTTSSDEIELAFAHHELFRRAQVSSYPRFDILAVFQVLSGCWWVFSQFGGVNVNFEVRCAWTCQDLYLSESGCQAALPL